MNIVYFDCFSGASGDMVLGALIDAGAPVEPIRGAVDRLGLDGWELDVEKVTRGALRATKATVRVHDTGTERAYADIVELVERAPLEPPVKINALKVFQVLGEAEAQVHDVPLEKVHFHEVGSTDAIVDVVGCCAALAHLAPDRIVTSPIATGTGIVETRHGRLPLPVPAVTEIVKGRGVTLVARGEDELVTPTGAAILVALSDAFGDFPPMKLDATGYGAGAMERDAPNVVRALIGEARDAPTADADATVIETNLDDMSPELFPHIVDALLQAGAHDAWITPVLMKKGRPAFTLSALVARPDEDRVATLLFEETTTLGVRLSRVQKKALERRWVEVEVQGHPVRVKIACLGDQVVNAAPEYQDARDVARATGMPLKEVFALAQSAARPGTT